MWIELRGGPRDGEVLEIPNDLRSVRFPMAGDMKAELWGAALADVSRIPRMEWVEYGPTEQYSPFWSVWSYGR